ncbi:hypothetical protein T4E_11753, partial [Trichinella pseudospiralis]
MLVLLLLMLASDDQTIVGSFHSQFFWLEVLHVERNLEFVVIVHNLGRISAHRKLIHWHIHLCGHTAVHVIKATYHATQILKKASRSSRWPKWIINPRIIPRSQGHFLKNLVQNQQPNSPNDA